jgi:tetratricopeptide (TPR) repeat protein
VLKFLRAHSDYSLGKVQVGRADFAQAIASAQRLGYKELSGAFLAVQGWDEARLGYLDDTRKKITEALATPADQNTQKTVMALLAITGDAARSQKSAEDLAHRYPSDTLVNNVYLPLAQALIDLQHNQPAKAVAHLQVAVPYEFGASGNAGAHLDVNFVLAEAFLQLKDGAKGAAEYQKILAHRGIDPLDLSYNLSHLGLGRAYALQGDTAQAKAAYQDFFGAWKDADPDVPVLKEARAEYAKLQ